MSESFFPSRAKKTMLETQSAMRIKKKIRSQPEIASDCNGGRKKSGRKGKISPGPKQNSKQSSRITFKIIYPVKLCHLELMIVFLLKYMVITIISKIDI